MADELSGQAKIIGRLRTDMAVIAKAVLGQIAGKNEERGMERQCSYMETAGAGTN